jgi:hypothetical protein
MHGRILLAIITTAARRGARARRTAVVEEEAFPNRAPTEKEARDSGATLKAATSMPWLPTHSTNCNGRPCEPGEGNLRGYKMWGQPYIHREAWVQAKSRRPPHTPDPTVNYAELVRVARGVAQRNLVVMAAGDWDVRLHTRRTADCRWRRFYT